jgi:hypothetical protein
MNREQILNRTVGFYFIAIAGTFLIVAGLVYAMYRYTQPAPLGSSRAAERGKARAEITAANTEALNNYGWVDQGKGIVRMPITNAVQLTLREWQNPAAARSNLIARAEKAAEQPPPAPKPPEKPNPYE